MKKFITRAAVVILIGGMSVAIGGCYGPFRLTSKLHHWNGQVSQKKFVNELVFLGMCIIPAYEICILGDGLPESDQHERRATGRSEVRL